MPVFKLSECLCILLLSLEQVIIPLLVELLVLLDVSLLALFPLLLLVEDELLVSSLVVLVPELSNPVLGHFSLDILAFLLASLSVLLQGLTISNMEVEDGREMRNNGQVIKAGDT